MAYITSYYTVKEYTRLLHLQTPSILSDGWTREGHVGNVGRGSVNVGVNPIHAYVPSRSAWYLKYLPILYESRDTAYIIPVLLCVWCVGFLSRYRGLGSPSRVLCVVWVVRRWRG